MSRKCRQKFKRAKQQAETGQADGSAKGSVAAVANLGRADRENEVGRDRVGEMFSDLATLTDSEIRALSAPLDSDVERVARASNIRNQTIGRAIETTSASLQKGLFFRGPVNDLDSTDAAVQLTESDGTSSHGMQPIYASARQAMSGGQSMPGRNAKERNMERQGSNGTAAQFDGRETLPKSWGFDPVIAAYWMMLRDAGAGRVVKRGAISRWRMPAVRHADRVGANPVGTTAETSAPRTARPTVEGGNCASHNTLENNGKHGTFSKVSNEQPSVEIRKNTTQVNELSTQVDDFARPVGDRPSESKSDGQSEIGDGLPASEWATNDSVRGGVPDNGLSSDAAKRDKTGMKSTDDGLSSTCTPGDGLPAADCETARSHRTGSVERNQVGRSGKDAGAIGKDAATNGKDPELSTENPPAVLMLPRHLPIRLEVVNGDLLLTVVSYTPWLRRSGERGQFSAQDYGAAMSAARRGFLALKCTMSVCGVGNALTVGARTLPDEAFLARQLQAKNSTPLEMLIPGISSDETSVDTSEAASQAVPATDDRAAVMTAKPSAAPMVGTVREGASPQENVAGDVAGESVRVDGVDVAPGQWVWVRMETRSGITLTEPALFLSARKISGATQLTLQSRDRVTVTCFTRGPGWVRRIVPVQEAEFWRMLAANRQAVSLTQESKAG